MGDSALIGSFEPLADLAALEVRWRALERRAPPNIFTSWTWMGSWLRATGARPELLAVRDNSGADVALALIGKSADKRPLGRVATLSLNEAGEARADRAFIEYNSPLCRGGDEGAVARAIGAALGSRRDWRALRLSGLVPGSQLLGAVPARRSILIDQSPVYHVDLSSVRGADGGYLSLLSANTRSQIKRSAKDYGEAVVTPANDVATGRLWLAEMQALNVGRHADNAWDEPVFRAFAAEIVRAGMIDGSIELLRATAGDALLGYLLNFRCGGRVMNYQSAFVEPASARSKPGLMTHTAVIEYYANAGLDHYSLLSGKGRYKQSLATGAESLEWWMLERFSPALEIEYWLRRLFRR